MNRRKRLTTLFLFFLLLLVACSSKQEALVLPQIDGSQKVTLMEEPGDFALFFTMDTAQSPYAQYFFDPALSQEDRTACLTTAETLLASLTAPVEKLTLCIYAPETYPHTYISGNALYTCTTSPTELGAEILLTATQGRGHYGIAYGLSALLLGDASTTTPILPEETALLDLNLLCFDSAFASPEDISCLTHLALHFAQYYRDAYGQEALEALCLSGTPNEVSSALSSYYESLGLSYTPSTLSFGYGGASYAYMLYDANASFYVDPSWQDSNEEKNPLVYEGLLLKNYPDVQAFFVTTLRQMEQYRELFALETYPTGLQVFFPVSTSTYPTSYYKQGANSLYIYNVDSLMHEYIHALTQPTPAMQLWKTEGFARYFSYRYDAYGMAFLNEDYNHTSDTAETLYVWEYLQTLDRPIDMAVDFEELENIAVYSRGYTSPNDSYVAGSSFVQYLVKAFGEAAVIDYIYGSGTPLPQPMTELVQLWQEYLQTNYSTYSLYP